MASVDVQTGRDVPDAVREFVSGAGVLAIDGQERERSSDGGVFTTVDPATEEVLAEIPQATADDVADAVAAAKRAHDDGRWRSLDPGKRSSILMKVSDALKRSVSDLRWVDTLDHGKSLKLATGEIIAASNTFRYFAGVVDKPSGVVIPSREGRFIYSNREPVGVCAQIIPWNFPLLMAAWKLAPALAFGNTTVLKPAEQTPLSALWLVRMLQEAGVPDGVVNLVQGVGEVTGQAMIEHRDVDKIAFTGSTEIGRHIARVAADNLTKVTLERGGKSPNIVFEDADLDAAVRGAFNGIFYNSGQCCTAGSRLLVQESIHDAFMERLVERVDRLVPGESLEPKRRYGPVISQEQLDRVLHYIEKGREEGATVLTGGARSTSEAAGAGYWLEPTIFDNVSPDATIAREEIFGPVLATLTFGDEEEAIELANRTIYGLAAALWTADVKRAHRVASRIEAGTVWVNTYHPLDAASPFGGYKQSGYGRELGRHALELYTQVKSVWVDLH